MPGTRAYLAAAAQTVYLSAGQEGLVILDVSNPAGPREIGAYPSHVSAYSLALVGNHLYVANGRGANLVSRNEVKFLMQAARPGVVEAIISVSSQLMFEEYHRLMPDYQLYRERTIASAEPAEVETLSVQPPVAETSEQS